MSTSELENLKSLRLAANFKRKTSGTKLPNSPINDAFQLMSPSSFQIDDNFITRIYLVGVGPWENRITPHFLDSLPLEKDDASDIEDPISNYCFPHGCKATTIKPSSSGDFISHVLSLPNESDLEFFTLYLPTISKAPYFHCCRFKGNPFTMPTFTNVLSLEDMFELSTDGIPQTDLCIAVQTTYPSEELYYSFIKWILQCEQVAKFAISPIIDSFLSTRKLPEDLPPDGEREWPDKHRIAFLDTLDKILHRVLPEEGRVLKIDEAPYPILEWKRPALKRKDLGLAISSLAKVLPSFTPQTYTSLLSAAVLEWHIVIYSKSMPLATAGVMTVHSMINPLSWVAPTISMLPEDLIDMLDSPSPTLIGLDFPLKSVSDGTFYIDLDSKKVTTSAPVRQFPKQKMLIEKLAPLFESGDAENIIKITNMAITDLTAPVRASIITDFSSTDNSGSRFQPELFLKNCAKEDRAFVNEMMEKQLFQFFIELKCRKCTEEMRLQNM